MNIAFFSLDSNLQKWVKSLGDNVHLVKEIKHLGGVVQDLLDKDPYREMILFLDFDWDQKKVEAFNKRIASSEDGVIRMAISSEMSIKELKKHQQGKTSCHGYLRKPLTYVLLRKILEDFGLYDSYKDSFDFELPELEEVKEKTVVKQVSKEEVIEDLSNELFGEKENTVTSLEDIPEISDPEASEVDLEIDENDEIEDDFDLDIDEDEVPDFNASELKVNTVVKNLVELHSISGPEAPYECELNDRIQYKFDSVFPQEFEEVKSSGQPVREHFMDPEELQIAPITVHLDEELENELDELTQNRKLPSPEELSEFAENTGDIDISSLNADKDDIQIDYGEVASDDLALDSAIDLDEAVEEVLLTDDTNDNDELSLQDDEDEDLSMSDKNDSLDLDDMDFGEESSEGELSFSDDSGESDELDLSEDLSRDESSSEGGLDLDLSSDIDDIELDSTETKQAATIDDGAMELGDLGDFEVDGMDLESHEVGGQSIDEVAASSDVEIDVDDLDLDDPMEDITPSSQAEEIDEIDAIEFGDSEEVAEQVVFSENQNDGTGEFEFSVEEDEEVESPRDAGTSSFVDAELNFGSDEDDENIDATTVFNAGQVQEQLSAVKSKISEDQSIDEDLGFSVEEDMAEDLFSTSADDSGESDFNIDDFDDDDDDTNPTMLMSQDMTSELEQMLDEEVVTKEFRPETPTAPDLSAPDDDFFDDFSDEDTGDIDIDAALAGVGNVDEDNFEDDNLTQTMVQVGFGEESEATSTMITSESYNPTHENEAASAVKATSSSDEGFLAITSEKDRIPPSFHEGEAVRLQATIRQLREERETLLDEINLLKQEKKLMEQDNLGLRAELDEAKIEVSILKKRNTSDNDEMKYKLRISEEKRLYSEEKAKQLQKEFDRLQHKIRLDFNQIKTREKELEGQLELAKMDSESQVATRDKKILDLKRKIDQLEFNMENAVIKEEKSREDKQRLEDRLERIMKTLRGSIEVLEDDLEWQVGKKDQRKP